MTTAQTHAQWRRDAERRLERIVGEPERKPHVFHLLVPHNYPTRAAGNSCGGRFEYAAARDLTAAVLLWWLSGHASGDAPRFDLGDARDRLGALYDPSAERAIWPEPP